MLTKMLYERGYSQKEVFDLYYFLDSIMVLPEPMEIQYNKDINFLEKEATMPYITTAERIGRSEGRKEGRKEGKEGMLKGLEMILEMKFGKEGLAFFKKIQRISDIKKLEKILDLLKTTNNLSDLVLP